MVGAGASQAATVKEVFNADMLGTNQRYFESIAGVPRESNGNDHVFRVQQCQITATIGNGKVSSARMHPRPGNPSRPARAAGGMEVLMEMVLAGDKALDAADQWEAQMKKAAGQDYVIGKKFNCETRFDSVATTAFKDVPVNAITIGYALPTERCR
ncbi:hypothetical protein D3C71_1727350 [compost metagenome]